MELLVGLAMGYIVLSLYGMWVLLWRTNDVHARVEALEMLMPPRRPALPDAMQQVAQEASAGVSSPA